LVEKAHEEESKQEEGVDDQLQLGKVSLSEAQVLR